MKKNNLIEYQMSSEASETPNTSQSIPKQPRTLAQMEALARARERRMEISQEKRELKEKQIAIAKHEEAQKKTEVDRKFKEISEETVSGAKPPKEETEEEVVYEKKPKKKKRVVVVQESADREECVQQLSK